jgi:hypothetical protein
MKIFQSNNYLYFIFDTFDADYYIKLEFFVLFMEEKSNSLKLSLIVIFMLSL